MKHTSKQRPSNRGGRTDLKNQENEQAASRMARRAPRVFHNSYTRAGRRFVTDGWVIKLQHQGRRYTFSLRAATKSAATTEARAIFDTLRMEGWDAALSSYASRRKNEIVFPKTDVNYWRDRLLVRRYRFPPSEGSDRDLAAHIEHAGIGYWFPLGTPHSEVAAAKARQIYETSVKRGWGECCRQFSRELIIGLEWCSNPILWTYATIHTVVEKAVSTPARSPMPSLLRRVLIVEQDFGVRRALQWCINQHSGLLSVACESVESFTVEFETRKPHLVLLNRTLAQRLGFASPGQIASIRGSVPALAYSVAVDGDQLFVSTPGGAEGYMLKRVKPDRLLEPMLNAAGQFDVQAEDLLPRVKSCFKELLKPRSSNNDSSLARLTRRENEVLALLSKGWVDKEIAKALGISAWTVHGHIKSIFERLQVRTRTEAVVRYLEK